jgi:hypothetical protein
MRKTLLWTLALTMFLGGSWICPVLGHAQEAKPLVTVSFAGYDKLVGDIDFIGKLGGNPNLGKTLEAILKMTTPVNDLSWLDTAKPWGAVVQTQGDQFPMFAFLPVTDAKKFFELVGNAGMPVKDLGDGVSEITTSARPLYAQPKGAWLFIAGTPDALKTLPADPTALLGDLPQKYALAVRASLKNIPAPVRQLLLMQMQGYAAMASGQEPGETDDTYAVRLNAMKQTIQQLSAMINEMDELLVGWAIDHQSNSTYLDLQATAQPGTKFAKQFAQMAGAKTNFAGFGLSGAAATAAWTGTLSDDDVTRAKGNIALAGDRISKGLDEQGLPAEKLQLAKQVLGNVLEVARKTVENKKGDAGLTLLLDPSAVTLVAGGMVAEGAKLESALKLLAADLQKDEPALAGMLKLNAETHEGIRFHTLALPMNDPKFAALVGDNLDVVVGIGDSSAYVAAGRDAAKTLKQVIDQSKAAPGKAIPPARISLSAAPIAKFAAAVIDGPQKQMAAMLAMMLQQTSGKDHVTFTVNSISNGVHGRLEIEEGLLKLLGMAGQMTMGSPSGPPPANLTPSTAPAKKK